MTDELSRLARLETKLDDLINDTREVKQMVSKRDEVCMEHAKTLSAHTVEITEIKTNLGQLSARTWYIVGGVLLLLAGFILDLIKARGG